MCDPTMLTVASFAMTAASAYTGLQGQVDQADAINSAAIQNRESAMASMREDYSRVGLRQQQEQDAAGLQNWQRKVQERKELATSTVAAGEAGVTGLSVEGLLRDISSLSLQDQDNVNQGADWQLEQLSAEMSGIQTTTQGRMNSAPTAAKPSPWGAVFGIGSGAIGAYDGHVRRTGKDPLGVAPNYAKV